MKIAWIHLLKLPTSQAFATAKFAILPLSMQCILSRSSGQLLTMASQFWSLWGGYTAEQAPPLNPRQTGSCGLKPLRNTAASVSYWFPAVWLNHRECSLHKAQFQRATKEHRLREFPLCSAQLSICKIASAAYQLTGALQTELEYF